MQYSIILPATTYSVLLISSYSPFQERYHIVVCGAPTCHHHVARESTNFTCYLFLGDLSLNYGVQPVIHLGPGPGYIEMYDCSMTCTFTGPVSGCFP